MISVGPNLQMNAQNNALNWAGTCKKGTVMNIIAKTCNF